MAAAARDGLVNELEARAEREPADEQARGFARTHGDGDDRSGSGGELAATANSEGGGRPWLLQLLLCHFSDLRTTTMEERGDGRGRGKTEGVRPRRSGDDARRRRVPVTGERMAERRSGGRSSSLKLRTTFSLSKSQGRR